MERVPSDRKSGDIRPLVIETGVTRYAEGSVLIKTGHTHVLCTASIEESVPGWLKGKGQGWVTAEYGMLPRSTHTRMKRDREKVSGRTQEIQRLIGRALRSTIDLKAIGERSIMIDCDVLQADGGTRTAAITGAYVALAQAIRKLEREGKLASGSLIDSIAAVSVGIKDGEVLVDLDYNEDSTCDVDMNFVMTGKGLFVEVQGTAERKPFSKSDLDRMTEGAIIAIQKLKLGQVEAIERSI